MYFIDYLLVTSGPTPTTTSSVTTSIAIQTDFTVLVTSTIVVPPPTVPSETADTTTTHRALIIAGVSILIVTFLSLIGFLLWRRRSSESVNLGRIKRNQN
ncbi:hypothetical protein BYT27DRAFT_7179527 [Phlegmacium glaucopus]|nr:hypothetical protein BYT27DRAFT_7179527 [Phlegmacium glaucopus]